MQAPPCRQLYTSDTTSLLCAQNVADDPQLANPLARQERMGTGWLAVIMEYEGLVRRSACKWHMPEY